MFKELMFKEVMLCVRNFSFSSLGGCCQGTSTLGTYV